jgi:hypothetical protein
MNHQGHSAKNDLSTEVLRDFCTRETLLRSVPQGHSAKNDLSIEVIRDFWTRETFLRSVPVFRSIAVTRRVDDF